MTQYNPNDFSPTSGKEINSLGNVVTPADGINSDGSQNVQGKSQKIQVVTALAKRDTVVITSNPITVDGMKSKRLIVKSSLDQAVNIQLQLTFDGGNSWSNVGGAKNIAASAGITIDTESTITGLNTIGDQIRMTITPAVAPTTGTLDVVLQLLPF